MNSFVTIKTLFVLLFDKLDNTSFDFNDFTLFFFKFAFDRCLLAVPSRLNRDQKQPRIIVRVQ